MPRISNVKEIVMGYEGDKTLVTRAIMAVSSPGIQNELTDRTVQ